MWVRLTQTNASTPQAVMVYGTPNQALTFAVYITPSSGIISGTVYGNSWTATSNGLSPNEWHHVAVGWQKSGGGITVYIDAVYSLSGSGIYYGDLRASSASCFAIGQAPSGSCV